MGLITRSRNFMNTVIAFSAAQKTETTVDILDSFEEGFAEFDRIVKKYTRFNENSELSNLNRNNGKWTQISEEFFYLVEYMLNLAHQTHGAFDPTIIDFLEVYGYNKNYDFSGLENPELNNLVKRIADTRASFEEIELDKKNLRVKLEKNQRIDLGGIGKGYAIDCAFEKIVKKTANFLIDAGGDIRAKGENQKKKPWSVGLKYLKDGKPEILGTLELNNEALACSGSWSRKVKQFHHLIDPKTGNPKESHYNTVFVKAPVALLADSWATAIFVGGDFLKDIIPKNISYFWK